MKAEKRGLSLIEAIIVIFAIGALACIYFVLAAPAKRAAQKTTCAQRLKQLLVRIDEYRNDHGQWPQRSQDVLLPGERFTGNDKGHDREISMCCPTTGTPYDYQAGALSGNPKFVEAWQKELVDWDEERLLTKYPLLRCIDHHSNEGIQKVVRDEPILPAGQTLKTLGAFWETKQVIGNVATSDELDKRRREFYDRFFGAPQDDGQGTGIQAASTCVPLKLPRCSYSEGQQTRCGDNRLAWWSYRGTIEREFIRCGAHKDGCEGDRNDCNIKVKRLIRLNVWEADPQDGTGPCKRVECFDQVIFTWILALTCSGAYCDVSHGDIQIRVFVQVY